jgi:hypothetical protein
MKNQITMQKHHRGYLVRWPAEWESWDFKTYREKYCESRGIGDESGFRKAQRLKRELIDELKEFQKSIVAKTATERNSAERERKKEQGLKRLELWVTDAEAQQIQSFIKHKRA